MAKLLPDFRVGDEYTIKIDLGRGLNIAGYKAWFTMKSDFGLDDNHAVLQASSVAGDHPLDELQNGYMHILVKSTQTKTIPVGSYFYDIQIKKPGLAGEGIDTIAPTIEYFDDKISVRPEVTRAFS